MDALGDYGSSSSSEDESNEPISLKNEKDESSLLNIEESASSPTQARKRQKLDAPPDDAEAATLTAALPAPRLRKSEATNPYQALIEFRKDYTKDKPFYFGGGTSKPELLENLRKRFGDTCTFASDLRKQKEFNNPHFFDQVVSHFEIEPNGSNLPACVFGGYQPFEEVGRIVASEEQSRIALARQVEVQQDNILQLNLPTNRLA